MPLQLTEDLIPTHNIQESTILYQFISFVEILLL